MNLKSLASQVRKKKILFTLVIFIVVALVLRFYNFPFRYGLSDEPVRDAAVATTGVREFQLPLTGPFSSAGPFTFGPWYYYQLILAKAVLQVPYAPWIYLSLASAACIVLLYKIGEFFDKKLGLILAFLGTISSSLILSGTHLTNPNLSNLFAFLSIYLFLKLVKKEHSYWWSIVFGVALGIAINIHYQMMGLMILPVLLLIARPKRYLSIVCVFLGIFATFLPMLFFDLNNHWFNTKNIFYYYTEGKKLIYVPNRWLFYLRDFWPSYIEEVTGIPGLLGAMLMLLFGGIFTFNLYKRKVSREMVLLVVAFAFNFILLRYYWGERFFGYLNYIRPFVIIFEGYTFYFFYRTIRQKKLGMIYIVLLAIVLGCLNIPRIGKLMEKDKFTSLVYQTEGKLFEAYPDEKFTLYICPGPGNTYYSSQSHSLLFLLDSHNMLSSDGRPISYDNDQCYPPGVRQSPNFKFENANFAKIEGTDLIDISKHSTASISAMHWQKHSLKLIFDTTTRWWFKEQP